MADPHNSLALSGVSAGDIRGLGATAAALAAMDHPVALYLAGMSPGSRPTQIVALRHVAGFWGSTPWRMPWASLSRSNVQVIRSWVASKYAPSTANRILTAVRGVLRACADLELVTREHVANVGSVAIVRGSRVVAGRALERHEIERLFTSCREDPSEARGARDGAILGLLYGAGLRRAELSALDFAHLEPSGGSVRVIGKGNVERIVPLPAGARRALDRWVAIRGSDPGPLIAHVSSAARVFLRRYTTSAIYATLRRLARSLRLPQFSPHDLRRTYVGDLLDAGADLRTVQSLVGHADPATTARYDRRAERVRVRAAELLDVPA
jgi:site-specific recombinase XerD